MFASSNANLNPVTITARLNSDSGVVLTASLKVIENVVTYEYSLSPSSETIWKDETVTYGVSRDKYVNGTYDSTEPVSNGSMNWSSTSESVAIVNSSGVATGKGAGTTSIQIRVPGNPEVVASASLTVREPEVRYRYEISPEESSITVGMTQSYVVRRYTDLYRDNVLYSSGTTPTTVSNSSISWSSTNTSVATVSSGVATGRDYGDAVITATIDATHSVSANLAVRHTFVIIGTSSNTVEPGQTVTVNYQTTLAIKDISFWDDMPGTSVIPVSIEASSAVLRFPSDAPVNTAVAVYGGNESKDATDDVSFNVTQPDVITYTYEIEVSPDESVIEINDTETFVATCWKLKYVNGVYDSRETVNTSFTWSSSDTSIATMSGNVARGVSDGTVTITATCQYGSGTATLTVEPYPEEVIEISAEAYGEPGTPGVTDWVYSCTFALDSEPPVRVYVSATLYSGGVIVGYANGSFEKGSTYSNVTGELNNKYNGGPLDVVITDAYFQGGGSSYFNESDHTYYYLNY